MQTFPQKLPRNLYLFLPQKIFDFSRKFSTDFFRHSFGQSSRYSLRLISIQNFYQEYLQRLLLVFLRVFRNLVQKFLQQILQISFRIQSYYSSISLSFSIMASSRNFSNRIFKTEIHLGISTGNRQKNRQILCKEKS